MNLLDLADAVKARLDTTGLTSYDGEPPATPPTGLYVCLYTGSGSAGRDRYTRTSDRVAWQATFVCCATVEDGLRSCVQTVRDAFEDAVIDPSPAASRLTEVGSGPRLKTGPPGDQRLSQTLIYQLTTPRSIND